MSGICGWIGHSGAKEGSTRNLGGMLVRLNGSGSGASDSVVESACAMAIQRGIVPVDICHSDALIVSVEGQILWKSVDLTSLAARRGPAATLAELYRRHGNHCLQHIAGPFAVAILDPQRAGGVIAVDRMGTRGMCYAQASGGLIFGSTAESVAAHPQVGRRLSNQAIFNYLYSHVVPSPGTIFTGVQKLEPAECIVFRDGRIERRFYWQLRYDDDGDSNSPALEARFRRVLREAVGRATDTADDVGAFLSGGTDSSTVAGLLSELQGKAAKTYSIGFAAEGFDEMGYARIASRHFGTAAHEYYVTPQDVVEAIPIIASAYDEPFGNDSAVPALLCARMARADGVRTMLAGDGGDEIFGGNARYAKQRVFEGYWRLPASLRHNVIEPMIACAPGTNRIPPLRKLRSYVQQASTPLPDRLESYNFLHRLPLADILEPDFLAAVDTEEPLSLMRHVYQRTASGSYINRMMHLDLKLTLADNDLRKVSRMCDVAGVDVRYPLLDEALVEFSGELPPSLKVKGLKLRYFFKEALKDFLPPEIIAKTKHGFGMPFGLWLREYKPLAQLVEGSLDAFGRRGIVQRGYIDSLLEHHRTGHATYFGIMIWVLVMLEQWLEARRL